MRLDVKVINDGTITKGITASGTGCVSGTVTGITPPPPWGNQLTCSCTPANAVAIVDPVTDPADHAPAIMAVAPHQLTNLNPLEPDRVRRQMREQKPTRHVRPAIALKAALEEVSSTACPPAYVTVSNLNVVLCSFTQLADIATEVVGRGYNSCTQTFGDPQILGLSLSTTAQNLDPRVALNDHGVGLVVWQALNESGISHAFVCSYDASTDTFGATTTLAGGTPASMPAVAICGCDTGMITWVQPNASDGHRDVYACLYDPSLAPGTLGTAHLVSDGTSDAYNPQVAFDCLKHAVVIWQETVGYDQTNAGTISNIFGNVYTAATDSFGTSFNISETVTTKQATRSTRTF